MTGLEKAFKGNGDQVPFWFMRQAGRHLAEYRAVRETCSDFMEFCFSPDKATEVTLQPVRRYGMDAAIIFSDILVIPHAFGREVRFIKGQGPVLDPLEGTDTLAEFNPESLAPVYEALRLTRAALPADKSLIGFAGSPWTLACYMLEGKGKATTEFETARRLAWKDPVALVALVEQLSDAIAQHLIAQVQAGADVVQLFDSWAGMIPAALRQQLLFAPTHAIVKQFKTACPNTPMIGFAKGIAQDVVEYAATGVDGVGIDMHTSLSWAREHIPESIVIQGNLDPLLLATDKAETLAQARKNLEVMQGRRFIFNLGHGVVPDTPVENVTALAELIKQWNAHT